jgi:hypothetical protein
MSGVGQSERATQDRVIALFRDELEGARQCSAHHARGVMEFEEVRRYGSRDRRPWTEVHVYLRGSLRDQVRLLGVA